MRRLFILTGIILLSVTLALIILTWGGPFLSGGLFLLRPTSGVAVTRELPASYHPRHKGGVDPSTGVYVREDEDLILRRPPSFLVTRTYLSGDRVSRSFGVGTTSNAEWYLIGDPSNFGWVELILANGGRIHF